MLHHFLIHIAHYMHHGKAWLDTCPYCHKELEAFLCDCGGRKRR